MQVRNRLSLVIICFNDARNIILANVLQIMNPTTNNLIVRRLIQKYYLDPNPRTNDFISSHWQFYSEKSKLEFDDCGELLKLEGEGFGNAKWNSIRACVLDLLCIMTHLIHLKKRINIIKLYLKACVVCKRIGLSPTLDTFRQVCSLVTLSDYISKTLKVRPLNFLIVGDGYGILSCLIAQRFAGCTITLVDIGETLLFQAYYCQQAYPGLSHSLVEDLSNESSENFNYCATEDLDALRNFEFDVVINIASMQEMNKQTISKYFTLFRHVTRKDNLFYCCNRISKLLMGGEHIKYEEYPWVEDDVHLEDEICPWHRYFFAPMYIKLTMTNFRFRIPIIRKYDGPTWHRVTILSKDL